MKNLNDVQKYLQNKQVYFRVEITDLDFKTIAEAGKVHEINSVEVTRIDINRIAFVRTEPEMDFPDSAWSPPSTSWLVC